MWDFKQKICKSSLLNVNTFCFLRGKRSSLSKESDKVIVMRKSEAVLTSLIPTWHKLGSFGRGNLKWENASSRSTCDVFSWLMINVLEGPAHSGWWHLRASAQMLSGSWVLSEIWVSKPVSRLIQRLFLSLTLDSCPDFSGGWTGPWKH